MDRILAQELRAAGVILGGASMPKDANVSELSESIRLALLQGKMSNELLGVTGQVVPVPKPVKRSFWRWLWRLR